MIHFSRLTPRRQAAILGFLRWTAVLFVGFVLVLVGYYLYVNVINRAPAEVYVAQRGTAISAVYGTITINPVASLPLFAQNAGFLHSTPGLENITQANGHAVKANELLGTVVDEIGDRLLRQAQQDYDNAVARQKNGPASAGPLRSAQDSLRAMEKLPPGNVPQVTRDAARNSVNQLIAAVDNETIELRHLVDAATNALTAAQNQQGRTEIRAPFDGVLTLVAFGNGAYILPNQMIYMVATKDTLVTGQVNEEDVGQLKIGMKADMQLYAYGNTTFSATLVQIFPAPEASSSRYTVILTLDKPPEDIRFGLTGEMNIITGRKQNALTIPTRAIFNVDQVLIVDDGVVEQRTIKIGLRRLEFAEIIDGIHDGAAVIVSNQETFQPGQRVRPIKINDVKQKTR